MIHKFWGECKHILIETVNKLKSSDKRIALAKIVKEINGCSHSLVAKEFNVSRNTIRKGIHELESGFQIVDAFNLRGRKKVEEKLPNLLKDIKNIVDSQSQTDPDFKTRRLFTRLTVKEIKKQLIYQKGYTEEELPTNQTLTTKINELGYKLAKVKKVKPLKKIEETDKIFENLKKVHDENEDKENVVRISIDAKDRVKIGNFSRGGKNRIEVKTIDHDFGNRYITPFGILDLTTDHVDLIFTQSKVTADFIVDAIEEFWLKNKYNESKDTLIINADNGPENNSRRTQYIKRITQFSAKYNVKIILAYYPPYHSKYNPVERIWGCLEQHWNGDILDTEETVLKFAETMTWNDKNPFVYVSEKIYETGIKVEKATMEIYESALERAKSIGKWYVEINPEKCNEILNMEIKV